MITINGFAGLTRWEVALVYQPNLRFPHDKFCICIDWDRRWFFYINSEPPRRRKRREYAVEVERFEVFGLKKTSYIDTTMIIEDIPEKELMQAVNDIGRRKGPLIPIVISRIQHAVARHELFSQEQRAILLEQ